MLRLEAEKAARQMIMSEYRHHRYEDELKWNNTFLRLEKKDFLAIVDISTLDSVVHGYVDILGPSPLRSLKNSLICFITPLCRVAIEMGVESELSFALSDFYITYLEGITTEKGLVELFRHVALHYYDLVHSREVENYTKPIARAVRYIRRNLYTKCRVSEVAEFVHLERHYFSKLFSKQVGMSPAQFILINKLDEAKRLLKYTKTSVGEVAESLGFYDTAHFSNRYKQAYGVTPSYISKQGRQNKLLYETE